MARLTLARKMPPSLDRLEERTRFDAEQLKQQAA